MDAIAQAISNFGSQKALAAGIGVQQPTVSEWLRGERPVPPKRAVRIAAHPKNVKSERPVQRWELRPDDWWEQWPDLIGAPGAPRVPRRAA